MNLNRFAKSAVTGSVALAHLAGYAAPYQLTQTPRGTGFKEPAPNVIVSVDNSESMKYSSDASDQKEEPKNADTPTRLEALQAALKDNFSEDAIPDGLIRLAWQSMNQNNEEKSCVGFFSALQGSPCVLNGVADANQMQSLEGVHRSNFLDWVKNLSKGGGTPTHAMMARVGNYMKKTGALSPFSDMPGVANATQSSCRRSFHILMTDGDYNLFGFSEDPGALGLPSVGNADGTDRKLPDGNAYKARAPYQDTVGAVNNPNNWQRSQVWKNYAYRTAWIPNKEYRPTLADMAFDLWATDLQSAIPNKIQPMVLEPGAVKVGKDDLPEYWNPKNDPATWQHLNTHLIGFGAASFWEGKPTISSDAAQPTYSGDYAGLVDGSVAWKDPLKETLMGDRPTSDDYSGFMGWTAGGYFHEWSPNAPAVRMDLWHAALNGRGTFTPAANAQALKDAFKGILAQITSAASARSTSIAANSSKLSTGTVAYQAGYDTGSWSGTLKATKFDANGQLGGARDWEAAALLDARMTASGAHGSRVILSFSRPAAGESGSSSGIAFRWASLSSVQKASLEGASGSDQEKARYGQAVVNFLRGDRSNEGKDGLKLRQREHVLGDIVNSTVWHVGPPRSGFTRASYAKFASDNKSRTAIAYVGANDGMLHAFNASTGQEVFAYVPEGAFGSKTSPLLQRLSQPNYQHRYFVDGSPFVADVYTGNATTLASEQASKWKSYLIGTMGAGGKGYFVLDVTSPDDIAESGAASVVLMDTTATSDDDLGHQFQQPVLDFFPKRASQVTMLNDGRNALVLGNGYNSTSEKAMLWIQYLDNNQVLKLPAPSTQTAGTRNGLSAPRLVDRDGDGKADFAYAGDLLGNLWKFDLTSSDSAQWKASLGAGSATSTAGSKPQSGDDLPLFAAGTNHPITAAPVVVDHPHGGYMVVFGTGRLFDTSDESTTTKQYLYGVWDKPNGGATVALSTLVQQTIAENTTAAGGEVYRTLTESPFTYGGANGKRGWYIELPEDKERIIYPGDLLDSGIGLFSSTVPGKSSDGASCEAGSADHGWTMAVDLFSGAPPIGIVYDSTVPAGTVLGFRNGTGTGAIGAKTDGQIRTADSSGKSNNASVPPSVRRFGWRDLISSE